MRLDQLWLPPFMSEADIPNRILPALRWVIAGIVLFVLILGISDSLRERDYYVAAIYGALFIVTFVIAVKWHQIIDFVGRARVAVVYIGIAIVCALGLGFSLGGLARGSLGGNSSGSTGRITWSFDQPGDSFFLNMGAVNGEEMRIVGFQAHGKNTSADPVSAFIGVMRSDITNAERQVYLVAQEPGNINQPPLGSRIPIPTLPEETYGIPGLSDFDITTHDKPFTELGKDGEKASDFLRNFGPFKIILKYDGLTIERHFTLDQINAQIALLEKQANLQNTSAPRVTRKPTAHATPMLPLVAPAAPHNDQPKKRISRWLSCIERRRLFLRDLRRALLTLLCRLRLWLRSIGQHNIGHRV